MTLRRAFTLIELLTVIAITGILLTLIILPIFQSFNLTRNAQAFADAQDKGRQLTEKISREIANAVSVRNPGGGVLTLVNGTNNNVGRSAVVVRVPRVNTDGTVITPTVFGEVVLPYSKMDIVQAAPAGLQTPGGEFVDPDTGRIDPTLRNPKGPIALPIAPGQTLVRYFIGLRDPFLPYLNPYDGLLTAKGGGRDNLFVLLRAEVQPMQFRQYTPTGGGGPITGYVSNPEFFAPAVGSVMGTDEATGRPVGSGALLDDPRFYQPLLADGTNDGDRALRTANWVLRSTIQTEVSRYDMILPAFDRGSRRVVNTAGLPRLQPLVQFRPSRTSAEPALGDVAIRPGQEGPGGGVIAPDSFRTKMGMWSDAIVRVYPFDWDPNDATRDDILVGRGDPTGAAPGFSIYAWDPALGQEDVLGGTELFDVQTYDQTRRGGGRYPFSQAVAAADVRSLWLSNPDPNLRRLFRPYSVDSAKGRLITSFSLDEIGDVNGAVDPLNPRNQPLVRANNANQPAYTPTDDPGLAASPQTFAALFADPFQVLNGRFNKVFDLVKNDTGNALGIRDLDPSRVHRFMDLRVTAQGDGTNSPLDPGLGTNARIVPGSEVISAPDQNPGPNYGTRIRYTRVTGGVEPGPNQYRINYTDLAEPTNYALLGLSGVALTGFDPNVYDANQFVSAIIQPQFKAGYVQFCSDPNVPLPAGEPIVVDYRFQFNGSAPGSSRKSDAFSIDYDSRQLMQVLLTVRNYPQASQPNPQTVTLKATANVRNFIR